MLGQQKRAAFQHQNALAAAKPEVFRNRTAKGTVTNDDVVERSLVGARRSSRSYAVQRSELAGASSRVLQTQRPRTSKAKSVGARVSQFIAISVLKWR